jgi:hypothetical protein
MAVFHHHKILNEGPAVLPGKDRVPGFLIGGAV